MTVTLTWPEVLQAGLVGLMRQVNALRQGRQTGGSERTGELWGLHIEGAAGELAVAKALARYWPGVGQFRGEDVTGGLQVRTARPGYKLIVHPSDRDGDCFVFVTGRAPHFELRGWVFGREAKQQQYWSDPAGAGRPAYFVPVSALHSLDSLKG